MVHPIAKNGVRVMCGAGNNKDGFTDLCFPENDLLSAGGGVTSRTFCLMLEEGLPEEVREDLAIVVQDGVPIHTSHEVRDWLED